MKGDRILREPARYDKTGVSPSTWWRKEQRGEVPKRRRISANIVGWLESELDDWIAAQAAGDEAIPQPPPLKKAAERRRNPAKPAPPKSAAERRREPVEAVP